MERTDLYGVLSRNGEQRTAPLRGLSHSAVYECGSLEDFLHNTSGDVGQAELPASVWVCKPFVIQSDPALITTRRTTSAAFFHALDLNDHVIWMITRTSPKRIPVTASRT